MEDEGGKKKASSILKWMKRRKKSTTVMTKSKSWSGGERRKKVPTGCLSVYVGPEKERFVIKTECVNHPLFKMLLQDAELEYGFGSDGPLLLPCHVDIFCEVLAEMEGGDGFNGHSPCRFSNGCLSPTQRRLRGRGEMAKGAAYGLLSPLRSLSINHF